MYTQARTHAHLDGADKGKDARTPAKIPRICVRAGVRGPGGRGGGERQTPRSITCFARRMVPWVVRVCVCVRWCVCVCVRSVCARATAHAEGKKETGSTSAQRKEGRRGQNVTVC